MRISSFAQPDSAALELGYTPRTCPGPTSPAKELLLGISCRECISVSALTADLPGSGFTHPALDTPSRRALIALAIGQSLLLLLLHQAIAHAFWPATDPRWLFAAYTVVIGLPAFFYLGAERWSDIGANAAALVVGSVLLFWIGWHTGWVAQPYVAPEQGALAAIIGQLIVSGSVAVFIAAMLFRIWRRTRALPYEEALDVSWTNALTLAFLGLFLGAFWAMLALWTSLFSVIGIQFFRELFWTPEFAYPVSGAVAGAGLVAIRNRAGMVSTARGICEAFSRMLLPLAAVILVLFLAALPFTGVRLIWDQGGGSYLLLPLAFVLLFFFNAGSEGALQRSVPPLLRWLVLAGIVLLPVIVALAAWGVAVRSAQYGWSVQRLWGLYVIAVSGAYAVGYSGLILWRLSVPSAALGKLNIVLALAIAVSLALINTGILDFRRLATNDQVSRLVRGITEPDAFDALYLQFKLGQYGRLALDRLQHGELGTAHPELSQRIERARAMQSRWDFPTPPISDLRQQVLFVGPEPPDTLFDALFRLPHVRTACVEHRTTCHVARIELAGEEWWLRYAVFEEGGPPRTWLTNAELVSGTEQDGWSSAGSLGHPQCPARWEAEPLEHAPRLLDTLAPMVRIGNCAYQLLFNIEPEPISP
jgi:hypothetical protein